MDDVTIIAHLEELAERFGIEIRYEVIKQDEDSTHVAGGLCLFKGQYVLIVNPLTTAKEKIKTLAMALKHFDLDQIYVRPAIRELLSKIPEQRPFSMSSKQGRI